MKSRTLSILAVLALIVAGGCKSAGSARSASSAEEAFQRGLALYERGKYERSIEFFQRTLEFSRTGEWADDAQLYLARAYAGNREYILAASEFSRFSELYRNDPRRVLAEFERAMAYYKQSPEVDLDQTDTDRAIRQFRAFVERFPNSELIPQAEARIAELREKMARKQYGTAKLYERRELWEAAAFSFEEVFDQYPETEWADDALLGAMNAYIRFAEESIVARQAERYTMAVENYRRLVQVFPNSPLREEAEALNRRASARVSDSAPVAEN